MSAALDPDCVRTPSGIVNRRSFLVAFMVQRLPLAEHVPRERPEAGEFVGGIDVMLDDVEGEVMGSGEAPDCDRQQQGDFEARILDRAIASKSGLSIAVACGESNRALECSGFP
jgi:hypothetical protein